jgi:hypothetical protein
MSHSSKGGNIMVKNRNIGLPKRKGLAPIVAIVAVVMMSMMVIEGAIVNNFIGDWEVMKRSARETVFISVVDAMEYLKDSLRIGLSYSFHTAAYDVLSNGSFCAANTSYCEDRCFVPSDVPSLGCQPWWKVYDTVYAPEYKAADGNPPDPFDKTFLGYLAARFDMYYSNYSSQFGGYAVCPMAPGEVNISSAPNYKAEMVYKGPSDRYLETSAEFSYTEKVDSIKVTERNTQFKDTFATSALDIFTFARKAFVDEDVISKTFENVSASMPESCRKIPIGDTCSIVNGANICESKLAASCSGSYSSCDSDKDGKVSADELYNCNLKTAWKSDFESDTNHYVKASVETDCQKTGHNSNVEAKSAWSVNWKELPTDNDSSGINASTRCASVTSAGCGCEDVCDVTEPECGICTAPDNSLGVHPGTRPWITMPCGTDCCAGSLRADPNPDSCFGTNANAGSCTVDSCDTTCCKHTDPRNCDNCEERDAWNTCTATCSGSAQSSCNPSCCMWEVTTCTGAQCSCYGLIGTDYADCIRGGGSSSPCCSGIGTCNEKPSPGFTCDPSCTAPYSSSPERCDPKECGTDITPSSGSCACGCSMGQSYTISPVCDSNACGLSCCKQTATLYKDANCTYDYWGTVNASVTVGDASHTYPIYGDWKALATSFFVASGNAPQCANVKSMNATEFKDDPACCQAMNSTIADSMNGCRI